MFSPTNPRYSMLVNFSFLLSFHSTLNDCDSRIVFEEYYIAVLYIFLAKCFAVGGNYTCGWREEKEFRVAKFIPSARNIVLYIRSGGEIKMRVFNSIVVERKFEENKPLNYYILVRKCNCEILRWENIRKIFRVYASFKKETLFFFYEKLFLRTTLSTCIL